jgi:hypothetical protein
VVERDLAEVFDREWEIVLERAKQSKELTGILDLVAKWRLYAPAERREPGWYSRLMTKADRIERTGQNPDSVSLEDVRVQIARRLGR